jgi:hypothetical protein
MSDMGIFPLGGPILSSSVSMTAVAAKIPATPLAGRRVLIIQNVGSETVYIGASTVTSAQGFDIAAGDSLTLLVMNTLDVYGICAAAKTSTVKALELAG